MNASTFLDELMEAGIRLKRDGDALVADVLPTADLSLHTQRITTHKSAVRSALQLRERIIATVDVEPEHFNREEYDRLWAQWHAHESKEKSAP